MKKQILFIGSLFCAAALIAQPTITTVAPGSGPIGSNINIGGTGFNTTTSLNVVYFGATRATVNSATSTSLNVTVPFGANLRFVSALNSASGLSGYSNSMYHTNFACSANLSASTFTSAFNLGVGSSNGRSVQIGDLDGDGRADVITADAGGNILSVYRNISTPGNISASSFGPAQNITTPTLPYGIVVMDFDGDGKLDVATCNYSANNIFVLRNTSTVGNISFATGQNFATGAGPFGIGAGDIDRDGKPEIVSGNYDQGGVSVLRNTSTVGNISFASFISYAGAGENHMIEVVDIDGDAAKDVCVVSRLSGVVSVYRNVSTVSNVTLSPRVDFATLAGGDALGSADMDGDGKLDLVVAGIANNNVSVLRNTATNGTITASSFATPVTLGTGQLSYGLSLGDVTGDGKPDIFVCGNSPYPIIQNLSTVGNIVLSAPLNLTGPSSTGYHTAIGDLDNDGKNDAIWAPLTGTSLSIYRNITGVLVTPNVTNVNCNNACNGNVVLSTNASTSTVVWSNSSNSYTLSNVCAGVYSYSLTTGTCVATGSVNVNQPAAISLTTTASNSLVCSGNSATLNVVGAGGTGTLSYLWSNNSTSVSTVVTPTANTVYSVTATDANTCTSTSTVSVGISQNPTVTVTGSVVCIGNGIVLTANGANTYTWNTSANTSTIFVSPTVATVYTVSGQSAAGCSGPSSTVVHTLNVAPLPTVTAVSSTSLLCSGSTATLTASGASTYSWTGVGANAQAIVSPTANTTYTVTGTDGNGCSSTALITQSVTVCSGIQESAINSGMVLVYPNPASDLVTVKMNQFTEGALLTVYSSLGQIVYKVALKSDAVKIDLSSMEAGLYTLVINASNQAVYTAKLVKQ